MSDNETSLVEVVAALEKSLAMPGVVALLNVRVPAFNGWTIPEMVAAGRKAEVLAQIAAWEFERR